MASKADGSDRDLLPHELGLLRAEIDFFIKIDIDLNWLFIAGALELPRYSVERHGKAILDELNDDNMSDIPTKRLKRFANEGERDKDVPQEVGLTFLSFACFDLLSCMGRFVPENFGMSR